MKPMPMKSRRAFRKTPLRWCRALLLGLSAAAAAGLSAADTNVPPAMTPEQMFEGGTNAYTNWIDFTAGQAFVTGNRAQFQQQHQIPAGAFGGIGDFHFQTGIATNTTMTLDGHAIAENHDYKLALGVDRDKVGFLRLSYDQSRTWSDGDGGFFPGTGQYYPAANDPLGLDRGKLSLEAGWAPETGPKVTFKYTHSFREGSIGSTEWGYASQPPNPLPFGLSSAQEQIHEHSDSFQVDVANHIKATDLGLGLRYETGHLDDALQTAMFPGEPVQQDLTWRQGTSYDLFDAHVSTETWVKTNVMVSTGFSYSGAGNTFSGGQIYGNTFNAAYSPGLPADGVGYYGLAGTSRLHEYVFDINLFYKPAPHFSIVPSLRAERQDWNAASTGLETLPGTPDTSYNYTSDGIRSLIDLRERLDLNYNGVTNWAFYARSDFTEGDGDLHQTGGMVPYPGPGNMNPPVAADDRRFFQKYSAGARWYPSRRVTLDVGGYYKNDQYHYDTIPVTTPYNGLFPYSDYLPMQNYETYDANVRLTLRPWQNVTAISRYEYQLSTIHTEPDAMLGLSQVESSRMTSHILAQDVSWIPWSRLSLQAGLNYVLSDTHTPASDVTQAILTSQNNYWTLNFTSGLVLDDKTDLNLSYLYYLSGDYSNNSPLGVPYGAGSEEHAITATLTRRLSNNLRLALKYGWFRYDDAAFGANRNFGANLISASLRYRF
jgi:hypothetical protein